MDFIMIITNFRAKFSNITHILPKPRLNLLKSAVSHGDVVEISGAKFKPIEINFMKEVMEYSIINEVETARILSKNDKLLDFHLYETPDFVGTLSKKGIKILGKDIGPIGHTIRGRIISYNGTNIHSHTIETPISGIDVVSLVKAPIKKIISITPEGKFSYLECPNTFKSIFPSKKCKQSAQAIDYLQAKKGAKLGLLNIREDGLYTSNFNNADKDTIKEYSNYTIDLLQKFADEFGFNFKHNFK